jgi:predicted DNA-binding transcriptional regulator AlpA
VYGWVNAGTIPVHKGGKKLRFLKSEINNWLKQGRKKTLAELASEADTYLSNKKKG